MVVLWRLIRGWHIRIRRSLMLLTAVLFFFPGFVISGKFWIGPAFFIAVYDTLGHGISAMWRSGIIVIIAASMAVCAGLFMPTYAEKKPAQPVARPGYPSSRSVQR